MFRVLLLALALILAYILLPVGLIAAGVGLFNLGGSDQPIECGDEEMPDDDNYQCVTTGSVSRTEDYDDMVKDQERLRENAPYLLGFGSLAALVGGSIILVERRTRPKWN